MPGVALVLSGGGMFGAYQAGVWSELAGWFRPDMVVGASVGSLNGWAIAGEVPPGDLIASWLDPAREAPHQYRWPRSIYSGIIDSSSLESWIEDLHQRYRPRTRFGVALTRLWDFQPVWVEHPNVRWQHLAASCGVPVFLPQYHLDGRRYADGGLLTALPLWAAIEMGADRFVAVNLLADGCSPLLGTGAKILRRMARFDPPAAPLNLVDLSPRAALGEAKAMIEWSRPSIERWIEEGAAAARSKKHFIRDMF
jgi:NTE family protein